MWIEVHVHTLEWVGIIDEFKVLDVILLITIVFDQGLQVLICHCEAEISQDLSELFGGDLEMLVFVEILEETLSIESVPL